MLSTVRRINFSAAATPEQGFTPASGTRGCKKLCPLLSQYSMRGMTCSPYFLCSYPEAHMGLSSEQLRLKIVTTWAKLNSIKGTARALGVGVKLVRKWVGRYQSTGGVQHKPSPGRPRALKGGAAERALQLLLTEGCSGAESVARTLHSEGVTPAVVHRTTVVRAARREARAQGTPIHVVRGKPAKQLSPATKQKRLAFARANLQRDWTQVMFTDRKKFMFSHPGAKVGSMAWVVKGSKREACTASHAQCVNVYAGITPHGATSCHPVAGTSKHKTQHLNKQGKQAKNITASEYREVLQVTLLPEGNKLFRQHHTRSWVLQQDNDPTHKVAHSTVAAYRTVPACSIEVLKDWPPNSPDLNPIENVWSYVQRKVNLMGCKTFEDFKEAVLQEVQAVPQEVLANLYASMPRRLQKVIDLEGGKTGY